MIARVIAAVVALGLGLTTTAHADPLDELGFGAAASDMAGSRAAITTAAERFSAALTPEVPL